ncbi:MAG TPA: cell wall hydrolase [Sphingomonadaceae bacterium]|nr:cell wall hydrolase [Sphingomonadaceae bacterium]
MPVFRRSGIVAGAISTLAVACVAIPVTYAQDALLAATASVAAAPISADSARLAMLTAPTPTVTEDSDDADSIDPTAALDPQLECMAKVVHHEAANQSFEGQLAVAQLIMNRVESDRFPDTPCDVANQPGQFFATASYHPNRHSETWASAVEAAHEALAGTASDVSEGTYFYHAAYQPATAFFRTRTRVMKIGDHIFYR